MKRIERAYKVLCGSFKKSLPISFERKLFIKIEKENVAIEGNCMTSYIWFDRQITSFDFEITVCSPKLRKGFSEVGKDSDELNESKLFHEYLIDSLLDRTGFVRKFNEVYQNFVIEVKEVLLEKIHQTKQYSYNPYKKSAHIKLYRIEETSSVDYGRVGKDTRTSTSFVSYCSLEKINTKIDDGLFNKVQAALMEKRFETEELNSYHYSRPSANTGSKISSFDFELSQTANRNFHRIFTEHNFLTEFNRFFDVLKANRTGRVYPAHEIWEASTQPPYSIQRIECEKKTGVYYIQALKVMIYFLYYDVEKLRIENLFFWEELFFLIEEEFFYEKTSVGKISHIGSFERFKAREKIAIDKLREVFVDNSRLIDDCLSESLDINTLNDYIEDYLLNPNSKRCYNFENIDKAFGYYFRIGDVI